MKFKQCIFIMFIGSVFLFLPALSVFSQEDAAVVDNSVFDHSQRPAALFDHDDHNEKAGVEEDCSICHHVYEDKKLIQDESSEDSLCSECHFLKATHENAIPLRMAFHNRCKTCHFESKKGPVLCGECHIRK